jgi:hypothetical protein
MMTQSSSSDAHPIVAGVSIAVAANSNSCRRSLMSWGQADVFNDLAGL